MHPPPPTGCGGFSNPKQKKNAKAFFDRRAGARGVIRSFETGFPQSRKFSPCGKKCAASEQPAALPIFA
jgi:hypothetical protein